MAIELLDDGGRDGKTNAAGEPAALESMKTAWMRRPAQLANLLRGGSGRW